MAPPVCHISSGVTPQTSAAPSPSVVSTVGLREICMRPSCMHRYVQHSKLFLSVLDVSAWLPARLKDTFWTETGKHWHGLHNSLIIGWLWLVLHINL